MTNLAIHEEDLDTLATPPAIVDTATMELAVSNLSILNKRLDAVEAEKNKVMRPILDAAAAERKRWKPTESVLEDAISAYRYAISKYQTAQKRIADEKAAKIAARVSKGTLKAETAIKKMGAIVAPEATVESDTGTVTFRTDKVLVITDETLIPRYYLMVDEKKLLADLKKGVAVYGAKLEEIQVPVNFR